MPIDFFRTVFDHVQIGCSDFAESERFYRTVLEPLGVPIVSETEQWVMFMHYAIRPDRPPTTNLHVAFLASSRDRATLRGLHAGHLRRLPARSGQQQRRGGPPSEPVLPGRCGRIVTPARQTGTDTAQIRG